MHLIFEVHILLVGSAAIKPGKMISLCLICLVKNAVHNKYECIYDRDARLFSCAPIHSRVCNFKNIYALCLTEVRFWTGGRREVTDEAEAAISAPTVPLNITYQDAQSGGELHSNSGFSPK